VDQVAAVSLAVRCDGPACPADRTILGWRGREGMAGWVHLDEFGPRGPDDSYTHHEHDFCSWACLTEFVTARALIESAGGEPS
jgi:hypothetical protein